MFSNVLVGVDGRQGGRDAIALARQLATPDASIALVHVHGPECMLGRGTSLTLPIELAGSELLRRERQDASLDAELIVRADRQVGRALRDLAEQRDADLLVVGSSRRALLERAVTADDCGAPLNGTPCAIALAPRSYAHAAHRIARLGVGYDGSAQSVYAMRAARALAARHGADIKALWVISLQMVREEKPIPADWPAAIVELLDRCSHRLQELGDVDGAAAFAGPREELARFGEELDLLIVGSCSHGPIGRFAQGSVSDYLVGHAPCPVLVLARSESHDDRSEEARQEAQALAAAGW
jgi:nucleotide-binding universal stress UspA family protein